MNHLRPSRLEDYKQQIFAQIVELFMEEGFISLDQPYIHRKKIEANANKFTFVWKKAIATCKKR